MLDALAIFVSVLAWFAGGAAGISATSLPRKRQAVPAAVCWLLICVPPAMLVWRTGDAKLGMTFAFFGSVLVVFFLIFAPIRARMLGFGGPEDAAQQAELERRWAARRRARRDR